jgi:hypothetical protein
LGRGRYDSGVQCRRTIAFALSAGVLASGLVWAAPAQADTTDDAFLSALTDAGVGTADPANAAALGQEVCPMLSQPGQDAADVAAKVADAGGMSLGPATMFTGIAISLFCPAAVSSITGGQSPIPLGILGF